MSAAHDVSLTLRVAGCRDAAAALAAASDAVSSYGSIAVVETGPVVEVDPPSARDRLEWAASDIGKVLRVHVPDGTSVVCACLHDSYVDAHDGHDGTGVHVHRATPQEAIDGLLEAMEALEAVGVPVPPVRDLLPGLEGLLP